MSRLLRWVLTVLSCLACIQASAVIPGLALFIPATIWFWWAKEPLYDFDAELQALLLREAR